MIGAVAIPLHLGPCLLENAIVWLVPPHTAQVTAVYRCGGLTCWRRWIETDGEIKGESRVCERPQGDRLEAVPDKEIP